MMASEGDTSLPKKKENQAFMVQAMKQQLKRMDIRFDELFEHESKRDVKLQKRQS